MTFGEKNDDDLVFIKAGKFFARYGNISAEIITNYRNYRPIPRMVTIFYFLSIVIRVNK
jgi:hypothetical protein